MSDKKDNWFKRHKILSVILALFIIGAIGASGDSKKNDTSKSASTQSASTAETSDSKQTAKIGQPVRDGKFEFTVNKLACGETKVGGQYTEYKAQGQFCRLNVTVKNIGDEAQTLSHSAQFTYNGSNKYSADSSAAIYDAPATSARSWYTDINPGNTVSGDILFDVPTGVTPNLAELHDDVLSGGVQVSLQ